MQIGKEYRIESDSMNIIVSKRYVPKEGKNAGVEEFVPEAYFSTFESALKWLVDDGVRETLLTDLKTVTAKQNELYALIKEVAKQSNMKLATVED